ncbi:MAG: response regulator [Methylococcaceae bacterium]
MTVPDVYILIVDDVPKNLFALEKVLGNLEVNVIKANSGEEALAHTLNYDFALAILDVQMPDMNGYELADLLLGDPSTSRIPIIFLTAAYADEHHSFQGYESGAVDYIVKPFDPMIFLSKVKVFLELARYRIGLERTVEERTRTLLEEGNKLRLLVENTPDCILNLDREGNIIFINHSSANINFIGQSGYQFFSQADMNLQQKALDRVFVDGKIAEFESNMKLPWNPDATIYSHRLAPIMRNNDIAECVQISRDITQLKLADEARLKLVQAEAESLAKSKFLASMSHEIRTPMNAVLGYAQLLRREGGLTAQQKDYLEIIDRSGEHLLMLIDSVLDMAKIEAGRMSLEPSKVSFFDLLKDIERMFLLCARNKGLKLHVDYTDDLPDWLLIDANKVRQVLINLLGNALKFTWHGQIEMRAGLCSCLEDKVIVYVEVEDTGCGIEAENLSSIFNAFEQAKAGTKKIGAGLGLAVSNEFALMMNGKISVRSEEDKGSIFRFEFMAEVTELENRRKANKMIMHLDPDFEAPLVLVVDDEIDTLNLLGRILSSVGFNIRLVTGGEDAITAFQEQAPSLVLMDLKMDGMDGLELARRIRQMQGGNKVPMIMVTASPSNKNRDLALEAGVNQFMCKPVREQMLFEEIGRFLNVNYLYAGDNKKDYQDNRRLDEESIGSLPLTLRLGLQQSIRSGYIENIEDWIGQMESANLLIGQRLRLMAEKFEYTALLKLLDSPGQSNEK